MAAILLDRCRVDCPHPSVALCVDLVGDDELSKTLRADGEALRRLLVVIAAGAVIDTLYSPQRNESAMQGELSKCVHSASRGQVVDEALEVFEREPDASADSDRRELSRIDQQVDRRPTERQDHRSLPHGDEQRTSRFVRPTLWGCGGCGGC